MRLGTLVLDVYLGLIDVRSENWWPLPCSSHLKLSPKSVRVEVITPAGLVCLAVCLGLVIERQKARVWWDSKAMDSNFEVSVVLQDEDAHDVINGMMIRS